MPAFAKSVQKILKLTRNITGDHEAWCNIYEPEDEAYAEYTRLIEEKQTTVDDAMRGVDVLVADCAYTAEE